LGGNQHSLGGKWDPGEAKFVGAKKRPPPPQVSFKTEGRTWKCLRGKKNTKKVGWSVGVQLRVPPKRREGEKREKQMPIESDPFDLYDQKTWGGNPQGCI